MADAPDAVYGAPSVSPGARLLAAALWRHAPHGVPEPFVWPSVRTLAALTNTAGRTVRRQLLELYEAGLARRHHRGAQYGWVLSGVSHVSPPMTLASGPPRHPSDLHDTGACVTPLTPASLPPDSSVPTPLTPASHRSPIEAPLKPDDDDSRDLQERIARAATIRTVEDVERERVEAETLAQAHLVELDRIRRTVASETGTQLGWLSQVGDAKQNLARAIEEHGRDEVCQVVEHCARLAATGEIPEVWWRRMFVGDGWSAMHSRWCDARGREALDEAHSIDTAERLRRSLDAAGLSPEEIEAEIERAQG